MTQPAIINNFWSEFSNEHKTEIVSLIKSGEERDFVSELSIVPTVLILVVALFLAMFSRGALKDAFMFKTTWEIGIFPEYFLLFAAQTFFVLLVLYSMFNYVSRIHKYGYVNASFGLVYIEGNRLTVYTHESIENVKVDQMVMNYKHNTSNDRWESTDADNADFSQKTKKYDVEVSISGQVEKIIFTISNYANAYAFVKQLNTNALLEKKPVNLPDNITFFSSVYKWFIVIGISLVTSGFFTYYFLFPTVNKLVIKSVEEEVINIQEQNGISKDKQVLINYLRYCPNGVNYSKAKENLKNMYLEKILPAKAKLLTDKVYRYEYLNHLTDYDEYINDGVYKQEIETLRDDSVGYELWLKMMNDSQK